jgi:hypothetical protein
LFSVYLYLELQKKLSSADVAPKLSLACDEQNKIFERQLRAIETEWTDMYQKFSRLAGRVDKNRGLDQGPVAIEQPIRTSRSDLLRNHRGGAQ